MKPSPKEIVALLIDQARAAGEKLGDANSYAVAVLATELESALVLIDANPIAPHRGHMMALREQVIVEEPTSLAPEPKRLDLQPCKDV